jgi:hypothetical protein
VEKFKDEDYDSQYIRLKALKFDKEVFKSRIKDYIEKM